MKANLDKLFKTDATLEKEGVWFDISEETGFLLRAFKATNPKMKQALSDYYKPYARQVELGTLEAAKSQELQIKMFIDVSLVDWKGVEIEGEELECTPENALTAFKRWPDLFDTLWKHANDFNNYREDLGNS